MPKGSEEHVAARKEEIVGACEKLYQTKSFKEITVKEIGEVTSFTRTSVYNYFENKEEIFLAYLGKEYERWCESLSDVLRLETADAEKLADLLARSLAARPNMLKLLSMNLYEIEAESRVECLTEFKVIFGRAMALIRACLDKFFSDKSEAEKEAFLASFFPFVYGIYPHSVATEKQKTALERAGVRYRYLGIYELSYKTILKLLE